MSKSKLYIAILDDFPDFMTPTLVAHSVLSAHLKFEKNENYKQWLESSFRKVVVRVNDREFNKLRLLSDIHLGCESSTLEGREACIVVCPRLETPNVLKFARMWKPVN